MLNLDNAGLIKRYDRSGILAILEFFPEQCRSAAQTASRLVLPYSFKRRYKNIICAGLGGSAIGADTVRSYIAGEANVPFLVNRNYTLPGFVNDESLAIVSSYSGDTEEAISAYLDAKAKKANVVIITSGGRLEKMGRGDKCPVVMIPKGFPPRCALGHSFFSILALLSKIGVIKDNTKLVNEATEVLSFLKTEAIGHRVPTARNPAKRIAKSIYLKYPLIYAGHDHTDCAADRWKAQLAENSKALSSSGLFPEMTHNEIVGWKNPRKVLKDFVAVILRDKDDHPRVSKRMNIVKDMIAKEGFRVLEVKSVGKGLLARIFSLIYIGDFVSFYLAMLYKEDPTPVKAITYLKKRLSAKVGDV